MKIDRERREAFTIQGMISALNRVTKTVNVDGRRTDFRFEDVIILRRLKNL